MHKKRVDKFTVTVAYLITFIECTLKQMLDHFKNNLNLIASIEKASDERLNTIVKQN